MLNKYSYLYNPELRRSVWRADLNRSENGIHLAIISYRFPFEDNHSWGHTQHLKEETREFLG